MFSFCLVLVVLASHFRARTDLPKKKSHLESGLNQRDRAKSAAPPIKSFVKTTKFFYVGGCPGGSGPSGRGFEMFFWHCSRLEGLTPICEPARFTGTCAPTAGQAHRIGRPPELPVGRMATPRCATICGVEGRGEDDGHVLYSRDRRGEMQERPHQSADRCLVDG